jgi:hypothetical protein
MLVTSIKYSKVTAVRSMFELTCQYNSRSAFAAVKKFLCSRSV